MCAPSARVVVAVGVVGVVFVVGVVVAIVVVIPETMEQATDANPGSPKRVRVDPNATNASKNQSPLACAQECLQEYIASLPPSTASILLCLARSHLQLRARLHNKKTQIKKMTNDAA